MVGHVGRELGRRRRGVPPGVRHPCSEGCVSRHRSARAVGSTRCTAEPWHSTPWRLPVVALLGHHRRRGGAVGHARHHTDAARRRGTGAHRAAPHRHVAAAPTAPGAALGAVRIGGRDRPRHDAVVPGRTPGRRRQPPVRRGRVPGRGAVRRHRCRRVATRAHPATGGGCHGRGARRVVPGARTRRRLPRPRVARVVQPAGLGESHRPVRTPRRCRSRGCGGRGAAARRRDGTRHDRRRGVARSTGHRRRAPRPPVGCSSPAAHPLAVRARLGAAARWADRLVHRHRSRRPGARLHRRRHREGDGREREPRRADVVAHRPFASPPSEASWACRSA